MKRAIAIVLLCLLSAFCLMGCSKKDAEGEVRAPMPGLVLQVCVSVGQGVKSGDVLLRLEAMKMENDIESQTEGKVKEILVAKGDEVQEGQVLMVLE